MNQNAVTWPPTLWVLIGTISTEMKIKSKSPLSNTVKMPPLRLTQHNSTSPSQVTHKKNFIKLFFYAFISFQQTLGTMPFWCYYTCFKILLIKACSCHKITYIDYVHYYYRDTGKVLRTLFWVKIWNIVGISFHRSGVQILL